MALAIVCLIAGGVFYYRLGNYEYGNGFTVAGLSVILGLVAWFVLGMGRYGYLGSQVVLFGILTLWNFRRMRSRNY